MAKVLKETPLAEITLRKYEKPFEQKGRTLYKKICLSIGVLQPGDSRDVIVDVLMAVVNASKERRMLTAEEVKDEAARLREEAKIPQLGIAGSNIRRQLRRLKDLFIIEKISSRYRLTEFLPLKVIFKEKIERYLLSSMLERVEEYLGEADR